MTLLQQLIGVDTLFILKFYSITVEVSTVSNNTIYDNSIVHIWQSFLRISSWVQIVPHLLRLSARWTPGEGSKLIFKWYTKWQGDPSHSLHNGGALHDRIYNLDSSVHMYADEPSGNVHWYADKPSGNVHRYTDEPSGNIVQQISCWSESKLNNGVIIVRQFVYVNYSLLSWN